MRKAIIIAVLAVVLLVCYLWLSSCPKKHEIVSVADPNSRRITKLGTVEGYCERNDTHVWLGIPYAQAPVGEWRWRAPRPSMPWQGTLEVLQFCEPCVQYGGPAAGVPEDLFGEVVGSEDCLYLNIWAPRFSPDTVPEGDERLPVMVWIHGGGNSIGTAATYSHVHNLAGTHKCVVVTINYRIGVLGWFYHSALNGKDSSAEDRSGNYGTLDMIQALRWVRQNIDAFGGDPSNVTIFGESAGGANVYSLLASPLANGLFHRAIVQSGGLRSYLLAEAENLKDDPVAGHSKSSKEILNELLIADGLVKDRTQAKAYQAAMSLQETADYLRSKTPAELLALFKSSQVFGMYRAPFIFRDGVVQPAKLKIELFADASQYNSVPVIIGSNRDEYKLFMSQDPVFVDKLFWFIPRIKDLGTYNRVTGYFSDQWKALGVDEPATVMRGAQGLSVYAYRFDWDEEPDNFLVNMSDLLGACHALDLSFISGLLDESSDPFHAFTEGNYQGRKELRSAMTSYWVEFAYNGAPGRGRNGNLPEWKPWDNSTPDSDKFIIFDTKTDGGIRMSSETVTAQQIKDRLLRDQDIIGSQTDLCRLYAKLFLFSFQSTHHWNEQEYLTFGKKGCRDCPPVMFR